ncbi:MAG: hypothetical protein ONB48_18960 [candidate division KSB1 bacterium]|nr:hypothetical protein [candidate division KSB1 bacterium]MDZ7276319.1 hypothetical protein [candidate division KSB1 bacterium]MDZ7287728.1 hypothetical protein [candidate division KSB1 bacterium]MDZ7299932.1 hypothetical protein [candidate division KSB1 bacterium]MDZ7305739.1 hypothetical protein [candidate division KSB1 bacterium]
MLEIKTTSGVWEKFCEQILNFLKADLIVMSIEGAPVRGFRSPDTPALWIRDHSDMLRGGKYFEPDLHSAVNCFAQTQAANGRIFDYVTIFPEKLPGERENWEKWVRVPVEADVEYRFVKAAYLAWQASGDDEWLAQLLPNLERALQYLRSSPLRWDEQHQLVKRPYTIDTWDFDYTAGRAPWLNFQITAHTYWGIFHGDNSGLYEAAELLARLHAHLGNAQRAAEWAEIAAGVRNRANALLFNGRFYTHFYKLTPVTIAGVDESAQLSLSNPMAINRGLATHAMALAIIREYQRRWQTTRAFAPWFGIDPAFPSGIFGDEILVPGAYINGGIFPLCGGELARAAFEHGCERFGCETLELYRRLIAASGATYLWYFPDGTPSSIETSTSPEAAPTDGWGSSAMLYAFLEGLCGIQDLGHSFRHVRCAPRWAATAEKQVAVKVGYAASGATFGYRYHLQAGMLHLQLEARDARVEVQALLPDNCRARSVRWNGEAVAFANRRVEASPYVEVQGTVTTTAEVIIQFESVQSC